MPNKFRRIGQGFCGTVWAPDGRGEFNHDGIDVALKREDGAPGRCLKKEWHHLQTIKAKSSEYTDLLAQISIPKPVQYWTPGEFAWSDVLPRLPHAYESCNAMLSERIYPISQHGRRVLTEMFCPLAIASRMMDDEKNKACVARCYLGRRKECGRAGRFFSLRNFPLYVDYAEFLDLPLKHYAVNMARALAFFHWACEIDGNDIEFVLGAPRAGSPHDEVVRSANLGAHRLWVLDFDCCQPLDFKDEDKLIQRIVQSFWRNDPYYPRPGKENESDQRLWELFAAEYVKSSDGIIERRFGNSGGEQARLTKAVRSVVSRLEEGKDITLH